MFCWYLSQRHHLKLRREPNEFLLYNDAIFNFYVIAYEVVGPLTWEIFFQNISTGIEMFYMKSVRSAQATA